MNCPDCGAKLSNINQKYCELCGSELININDAKKEEMNVKLSKTRFKRRCC